MSWLHFVTGKRLKCAETVFMHYTCIFSEKFVLFIWMFFDVAILKCTSFKCSYHHVICTVPKKLTVTHQAGKHTITEPEAACV